MHRALVVIWLTPAFLVSGACARESVDRDTWPRHMVVFHGRVEYQARVEAVPGTADRVRARLVVRNPGPDTVRGEYGPCSFALRAYEVDELAHAPAWDDRPLPAAVCEDIANMVRLAPREAHTILVERARLQRPIRPGRYQFRVAFRERGNAARIHEVPAGELRLAR